MQRERVIQELRVTLDELKRAEINYFNAANTVAELKLKLHGVECDLYNGGNVIGRNETSRAADLWPHTKELRERILREDESVDRLKAEYYHLRRKLEVYQTIGQLLVAPEVKLQG